MKYLFLLMFALPVQAHDSVYSAGYVFNGGYMLGYHSLHREQGEIGWYVNGIYSKDKNYNTQSQRLETTIQEFINNTFETSTTSSNRAIKCNPNRCFEFGPPLTTTTTTTTETTELVESLVYVDIYTERKVVDRDLILNLGANYTYTSNIFFYGGVGIAEEKTSKYFNNNYAKTSDRSSDIRLNINVGILFNSAKNYGFDVGYNTINDNLYLGFSYEW